MDDGMGDRSGERGRVLVHRLVLLGLLTPIVGIGVVFWLLLPGGVAGITYTPGQLNRVIELQPLDWARREVAVRGYLARSCGPQASGSVRRCDEWLLLDRPALGPVAAGSVTTSALRVLRQRESTLHATLRQIVPGLAEPFPGGYRAGQRVTLTGIAGWVPAGNVPMFQLKDL